MKNRPALQIVAFRTGFVFLVFVGVTMIIVVAVRAANSGPRSWAFFGG